MSLFKRKNHNLALIRLINSAVLSVFLCQMLFPQAAEAKILANLFDFSQKITEHTLAESAEGRMFGAKQEIKPNKLVRAVITAYSSTVDQTDNDPFTAASGKQVYDGMIAANWLPFGTVIKIPELYGDKVFMVDDRMNPRYGYGRLDIWLDAPKSEVKKFGVKRVEIEIYYPRKENVKVAKISNI